MKKMSKLTITISKTNDGLQDYVQIMSDDYKTINITCVTDEIVLEDRRDEN